jgi:aspartate-semialdehyde dehydrogenase
MKMTNEGRKIMGIPDLRVTCTTVRVPVLTAHSISINAQFGKKITREKARELIAKFPGCRVMDDPANNVYPMPLFAAGKDDCYVGRIREDDSAENCLNLWVCGDQLRKGAALNAVQIAEVLAQKYLQPAAV